LGPEIATSETHVHIITKVPVFYMAFGLNDFDGDKSIHYSGHWKEWALKTTDTLIINLFKKLYPLYKVLQMSAIVMIVNN
jgi:hypothetical protein